MRIITYIFAILAITSASSAQAQTAWEDFAHDFKFIIGEHHADYMYFAPGFEVMELNVDNQQSSRTSTNFSTPASDTLLGFAAGDVPGLVESNTWSHGELTENGLAAKAYVNLFHEGLEFGQALHMFDVKQDALSTITRGFTLDHDGWFDVDAAVQGYVDGSFPSYTTANSDVGYSLKGTVTLERYVMATNNYTKLAEFSVDDTKTVESAKAVFLESTSDGDKYFLTGSLQLKSNMRNFSWATYFSEPMQSPLNLGTDSAPIILEVTLLETDEPDNPKDSKAICSTPIMLLLND